MDIKSEKRWKLVPVTDLDVVYVGGMHDTITWTETDHHDETDLHIRIQVTDPKTGRVVESITCLKRNMASYKYRDRLIRVEDKSPLPVDVEDPPTGD